MCMFVGCHPLTMHCMTEHLLQGSLEMVLKSRAIAISKCGVIANMKNNCTFVALGKVLDTVILVIFNLLPMF